jgi:hypothetical protein
MAMHPEVAGLLPVGRKIPVKITFIFLFFKKKFSAGCRLFFGFLFMGYSLTPDV